MCIGSGGPTNFIPRTTFPRIQQIKNALYTCGNNTVPYSHPHAPQPEFLVTSNDLYRLCTVLYNRLLYCGNQHPSTFWQQRPSQMAALKWARDSNSGYSSGWPMIGVSFLPANWTLFPFPNKETPQWDSAHQMMGPPLRANASSIHPSSSSIHSSLAMSSVGTTRKPCPIPYDRRDTLLRSNDITPISPGPSTDITKSKAKPRTKRSFARILQCRVHVHKGVSLIFAQKSGFYCSTYFNDGVERRQKKMTECDNGLERKNNKKSKRMGERSR